MHYSHVDCTWKERFQAFEADFRCLFRIPGEGYVLSVVADLGDPSFLELNFYNWAILKRPIDKIYVSAAKFYLHPADPTVAGEIQVRTKGKIFCISIPQIEVAMVEDIKRVIEDVEGIPSANQAIILTRPLLRRSRQTHAGCSISRWVIILSSSFS
ncbi:hypothetical protein M408DRAFT_332432 [Serendipita vermifera MAFF 305830]|uniref:Ubiquitin-like domain-containing protein n=1 Tax=Serendipita vermifera MAFF 305830 TaxID=933852 RepID=A0A0C2X152_SERVB|nr:hypothetical protein M408DRAFT_332432 [Serendipita vermifera MAFF 305830]